jgi:PDZ domain
MSIQTSTLRRLMALAGVLAVTAGLANAQQSKDDKPIKGSFDQPLRNADADDDSDSNSEMMLSESDGQHTYTVKIENGKVVSAEVDGKKVPKSRVKNKNGKVEILDEDGNVQKSFNVQMAHGLGRAAPGGVMTVRPWPGQGGAAGQGMAMAGPQPPVMMGITMSDPSEGEGVMVDSVFDGLPADKAGLQVGDRIISADGKKIESQQALRDILKDKKPGDTIELKVEREGKNKNIGIKLAKFESNRLGAGGMSGPVFTLHNGNDEAFEKAKEALQKALNEIKANENLKPDKIKAKAEQALKEAMEALDKAKDDLSMEAGKLHDQFMQQFNDGRFKNLWGPEGNQFVVPQPMTPTPPPSPDISKQLDKLSDQIERLNKRLEQLEKDKK